MLDGVERLLQGTCRAREVPLRYPGVPLVDSNEGTALRAGAVAGARRVIRFLV